jgi:hypothetical protein
MYGKEDEEEERLRHNTRGNAGVTPSYHPRDVEPHSFIPKRHDPQQWTEFGEAKYAHGPWHSARNRGLSTLGRLNGARLNASGSTISTPGVGTGIVHGYEWAD